MDIRLLLVDDHQILRQGLVALLNEQAGMQVVWEVSTADEAVRLASELKPDVVVMDVALGKDSGIETTRRIREERPGIQVVALSVYEDEDSVSGMLEAGASGYVVKGSPFADLLDAIRAVLSDQIYLSPAVTGALVSRLVRQDQGRQAAPSLSPREEEVLAHLANGLSTKEIAFELQISARTIETHRRHIMEKLGIDNVAGLTKYAIRMGLSELLV